MKLMVGVKALIKNQAGEYLFLQRSQEKYPALAEQWDIPGGRIEPDEDSLDGLCREIREETGLRVKEITQPPLAVQDIFTKDGGAHIVRVTYMVSADGTPVLSDEHSAYRWLGRAEAMAMNLDPYATDALKGVA